MSIIKSNIGSNVEQIKTPITNLFYDNNYDSNKYIYKQALGLIRNLNTNKNNNIDYNYSINNKNLIFSDALKVKKVLELCFLPPRGILTPTCKGDQREYQDDHDDRGAPPCIPCC